MRVLRVCGAGGMAAAVVAAVLGAGGLGFIRDARSAPGVSTARADQVARLTKQVTTLEREVVGLQRTLHSICVHGQLVAHVTADSSGNLSTQYVHCIW